MPLQPTFTAALLAVSEVDQAFGATACTPHRAAQRAGGRQHQAAAP